MEMQSLKIGVLFTATIPIAYIRRPRRYRGISRLQEIGAGVTRRLKDEEI